MINGIVNAKTAMCYTNKTIINTVFCMPPRTTAPKNKKKTVSLPRTVAKKPKQTTCMTPPPALNQSYLKYKICVSGSADTSICGADALNSAKEVGKNIVCNNGVVVTGATTGIPYWAAVGAKEAQGISIGISPAVSELAHVKTYKLPTDYFDLIIYTGFDYAGRNLLLVRSSDAVIVVCGRIGTLNEFTIAFEDKKIIGVLEHSGGAADMIRDIVGKSHRGLGKIIYDTDPKRLVERVLHMIDKEKVAFIPRRSSKKTLLPSSRRRG